jgi:hypothetical protein
MVCTHKQKFTCLYGIGYNRVEIYSDPCSKVPCPFAHKGNFGAKFKGGLVGLSGPNFDLG